MFKRYSGGVKIEWSPDNETAAKEAMEHVLDSFDKSNTPITVDNKTAGEIKRKYNEIDDE